MKRTRLYASALLAVIAAVLIAYSLSKEQRIARHTRSWHRVCRIAMGNSVTLLDRLYQGVMNKTPHDWWNEVRRHEAALTSLGYLTNCEFRLTNQITTRDFSSNFFRLIYQRVGTNEDQVWRCTLFTNHTGISLTFRAKDYGIWEQTFRECAVLYASNLAPASVEADSAK
jgi:hypothetical protein